MMVQLIIKGEANDPSTAQETNGEDVTYDTLKEKYRHLVGKTIVGALVCCGPRVKRLDRSSPLVLGFGDAIVVNNILEQCPEFTPEEIIKYSRAAMEVADAATIIKVREVARACGYAVGVHGSLGVKDLDLMAIPWTAEAITAEAFVDRLCAEVPLSKGCRDLSPNKPHGRLAKLLIRLEDRRIIDLSIAPVLK